MVDLGPVAPWSPAWMRGGSNWLHIEGHGLGHMWARFDDDFWMPCEPAPVGIRCLINPITREEVPLPPGTEIMCDDLDWMVEGWQTVFEIEWKIRQAGEQR